MDPIRIAPIKSFNKIQRIKVVAVMTNKIEALSRYRPSGPRVGGFFLYQWVGIKNKIKNEPLRNIAIVKERPWFIAKQ